MLWQSPSDKTRCLTDVPSDDIGSGRLVASRVNFLVDDSPDVAGSRSMMYGRQCRGALHVK